MLPLPPDLAIGMLYNDLPEDQARHWTSLLRPQSTGYLSSPLPEPLFRRSNSFVQGLRIADHPRNLQEHSVRLSANQRRPSFQVRLPAEDGGNGRISGGNDADYRYWPCSVSDQT